MYSFEIDKYLRERNYCISKEEYKIISNIKDNPQISHIKYNCYDNSFLIETNDGFSWIVRIF